MLLGYGFFTLPSFFKSSKFYTDLPQFNFFYFYGYELRNYSFILASDPKISPLQPSSRSFSSVMILFCCHTPDSLNCNILVKFELVLSDSLSKSPDSKHARCYERVDDGKLSFDQTLSLCDENLKCLEGKISNGRRTF